MITIKDIIKNFSNKDNKFLSDVKLILQCVLKLKDEHELYLKNEYELTEEEQEIFKKMSDALLQNKPISKIISEKGFWKRNFYTNENTLDPRPDTECILESALEFIPKNKHIQILELGIGTGCLLFSLLDELPKAFGYGLEKSINALQVAHINNPHLNRTRLNLGSWLNMYNIFQQQKFDIIISNPPYVRSIDWISLFDNVRKFDPVCALNGGHNGLYAYRDIYSNLSHVVKKGTWLFLEIGQYQENDIIKIYSKKYHFIAKRRDLAGIVRCLVLRKK